MSQTKLNVEDRTTSKSTNFLVPRREATTCDLCLRGKNLASRRGLNSEIDDFPGHLRAQVATMLSWWMGKADEENRVQGDDSDLEPPETPAPVFAARALKSALFGTPALPDDDFAENELSHTRDVRGGRRPNSISLSPSKPPGILLTPGTATSRRKTVSFGNEVLDRKDNVLAPRATSNGNDWRSQQPARNTRKTTLTKALENAREGGTDKTRHSETYLVPDSRENNELAMSIPSQARKDRPASDHANQEAVKYLVREEYDGDVTMDLNEPHSQSGRYWKSEYQTYHDEAKLEMRKLLQYKHMAKNYAKKKDEENIDLSEKLKEQQRKVVAMEDKLSKLSARIAQTKPVAFGDDDSSELIKELARQTALAVQYKQQVEEFKVALEKIRGQGAPPSKLLEDRLSTRGELYFSDAEPMGKPESIHLKKATSLHPEIERLRQQLSSAEQSNQKLKEENAALTQQLLRADLRLERHLEKCENGRKSGENLELQRDQTLQALQETYDTLKSQAKSQRRDAEQLLKKRHDQAVELKREIASLKNANATVKELQESLQKKSTEHSRVVAEYEIQIAELKRDVILGSASLLDSKLGILQEPSLAQSITRREGFNGSAQLRGSQIPVPAQTISHPSIDPFPGQYRSETPTGSPLPRPYQMALSEIINNASPNTLPPGRTGPVHFSPAASRPLNPSNQIPNIQMPSSEQSVQPVSRRTIHERSCHPSPRPKMINIPSSPPKAVKRRPISATEVKLNHELPTNRTQPKLVSSRLTNMEDSHNRRAIPPERAAAAKARLEQKLAEKKAQAVYTEKENARDRIPAARE